MKIFIFALFLITVLAVEGAALAEETKDKSFLDQIAKYISIKQSIEDKNFIEKPAQFQLTKTSGKSGSYLVDVGVTAKYSTDKLLIGPTFEYHKKTETSKEQDNLQTGATAIYILGDVTEGGALLPQLSFKYKRDRVKTGEGYLGKLSFSGLVPVAGIGEAVGPDFLQFSWTPTIGIENEEASNVLKSGMGGNSTRGIGSVDVSFYPYGKVLRKNIEITARETFWWNITRSGGFELCSRTQNLFEAALNGYFDNDRHFGVGLVYSKGENPDQGLTKQEITSLSFLMKF